MELRNRLIQKSKALKYNKFFTYANYKSKVNNGHKGYLFINSRKKNLSKLNSILTKDTNYYNIIYESKGLAYGVVSTKMKQNINEDYYRLIATITEFFNCVAVWDSHFFKGYIEPIKTVRVYGFKPDIYICMKYLSNEINNLQSLQYNRQEYYRVQRRRIRRRGDHTIKMLDARTKAINYNRRMLSQLSDIWQELIDNQPERPYREYKYTKIYELLEERGMLKFNKHGKKYKHAIASPKKFISGKIIVHSKCI